VRNVAVDVTAETATAARAEALSGGQKQAIDRLLGRLTRRADAELLPELAPGDTEWLVSDFEVAGEKTSTVRYIARLTYRFKPDAVRGLLRQAAVPYAETPSKPVLIVPVLRDRELLVLWDSPNPWREAWAALPARSGLVPMIVPVGDLGDIADLTAAQAAAGDTASLTAVADRYGAADSLVAIAERRFDAVAQTYKMDVTVSRVGATRQAPILVSFQSDPEASVAALAAGAAEETAAAIEDAWIGANLLRFDQQRRMVLAVPLGGLADWVRVRDSLARVAVIAAADLRSLTRDTAEVEIAFIGDEAQLAQALAQQDLTLDAPLAEGAAPGALRVLRLAGGGR